MDAKARREYVLQSQEKMTDEEYQNFEQFLQIGNQNLEEKGRSSPWATCFLTFLNMIQSLGVSIAHIDYSKPFRIEIDYDPEQSRVAIHHYAADKPVSEPYQ